MHEAAVIRDSHPTSGSSGHRYGGMALAWCGWQQPRRLRSPLSHTVGRKPYWQGYLLVVGRVRGEEAVCPIGS